MKKRVKVLSALMSAALIATSVPVSALAAMEGIIPEETVIAQEAKDIDTSASAEAGDVLEEEVSASETGRDLLADFDFDDDADGLQGGQAKAAGSYTLKDSNDGKALYLDGSATNFLTVTKTDGSSLLTGKDEITISYDAKVETTNTNWVFYAAPNANTQDYNKEKYLGILVNSGKTTVERYNNNGSRPTSASVTTGSDWVHVDVVVRKTKTEIYVDGLPQASVDSNYSLSAILGNNSILQIGKANWGGGEYYTGWIDNLKIYGEALTESELIDPARAEKLIEQDLKALAIPSELRGNTVLPETGDGGTQFTWSMKKNSPAVSVDGNTVNVTRPGLGENDAEAVLVVTARLGSVEIEKEYTVKVLAVTGEELSESLVIPQYITGDLQAELNGEKVVWSCDKTDVVSQDGKVTAPNAAQKVALTAKAGTITVSGTATVLPYGGSVMTYVTEGDDLLAYADSRRSDALYVAAKNEETGTYEELNKGKAILYVKWNGDQKVYGNRQMGSPAFFRTAEGKLGLVASANNSEEGIYLWDSEDGVNFTNERYIRLNKNGIAVADPSVVYDAATQKYKVFWEGRDGGSFVTILDNLNSDAKEEQTIGSTYKAEKTDAKVPENGDQTQASVFVMSKAEYAAFIRKYGRLYNTSVDVVSAEVNQGETVSLPETITANYSDGSTKNLGVIWDKEDLKKLEGAKPGTYEITGEVQQSAYSYPFIAERADPHLFYNEDDGYYYSTGSYYEANMTSCDVYKSYRKLDIRRSKTIEGLRTAEEHYIMESNIGDRWGGFFWAPEFHKINGKWYCLVGAHDFGSKGVANDKDYGWCSRSILIPYEGTLEQMKDGGMLDASQWGEPIIVNLPSGADASFDISFYEDENGQGYYIIPFGAQLKIVKVQSGEGVVPHATGEVVTLKGLEWPWEYGILEGSVNPSNPEGNDQGIVEGPYLFEYGDKIYISYSGATVDKYYCLGLMMADKGSDIMDPASWTHVPYPALASYDTCEGQIGGGAHVGGGHNSIARDEYGNLILIYHARPYPDPHAGMNGAGGLFDPCRHTVVKSVNVAYDGTLVFNMTAEEELNPAYKTIKAVVVVRGETKPTITPTPTPIHKSHVGKTFSVNGLKYKVTKDDKAGREVRVTSMKGKEKTLKIPAAVTNSSWKETFKVTSVKAKAFKGKAITKAVVGKNVAKIGPNAFLNCKKLKSVVIGKRVKYIGTRAFYGCGNLKKITIKSTVLSKVKKNAFKRISKKAVISITKKSKKKKYKDILEGTVTKGVKIK